MAHYKKNKIWLKPLIQEETKKKKNKKQTCNFSSSLEINFEESCVFEFISSLYLVCISSSLVYNCSFFSCNLNYKTARKYNNNQLGLRLNYNIKSDIMVFSCICTEPLNSKGLIYLYQ